MRKHAFSIGLAVVILGLILGLTSLRAAPVPTPAGISASTGRYWLQGWNWGDSQGKNECFLLDTATGLSWRWDWSYNQWRKLPMPPGVPDPALFSREEAPK